MQAVVPPSIPKKPYRWHCKKCKQSGTVNIEEHADFLTGLNAVKEDHTAKSPQCVFDYSKVKVMEAQ